MKKISIALLCAMVALAVCNPSTSTLQKTNLHGRVKSVTTEYLGMDKSIQPFEYMKESYDKRGFLVERIKKIHVNDTASYRTEYTYDYNDRIVEQREYRKGKLYKQWKTKYKNINIFGTLSNKTCSTFSEEDDDDDLDSVRTEEMKLPENFRRLTTTNNQMFTDTIFDKKGEIYNIKVGKYNENGDTIEERSSGYQNYTSTYTYQYDKNNNWTLKRLTKQTNGKTVEQTIRRTIEYYK